MSSRCVPDTRLLTTMCTTLSLMSSCTFPCAPAKTGDCVVGDYAGLNTLAEQGCSWHFALSSQCGFPCYLTEYSPPPSPPATQCRAALDNPFSSNDELRALYETRCPLELTVEACSHWIPFCEWSNVQHALAPAPPPIVVTPSLPSPTPMPAPSLPPEAIPPPPPTTPAVQQCHPSSNPVCNNLIDNEVACKSLMFCNWGNGVPTVSVLPPPPQPPYIPPEPVSQPPSPPPPSPPPSPPPPSPPPPSSPPSSTSPAVQDPQVQRCHPSNNSVCNNLIDNEVACKSLPFCNWG